MDGWLHCGWDKRGEEGAHEVLDVAEAGPAALLHNLRDGGAVRLVHNQIVQRHELEALV